MGCPGCVHSTKDSDALFEEFSSTGITFGRPIKDDCDGLHGFEVSGAGGVTMEPPIPFLTFLDRLEKY
jgi:hypothetical protein